MPSELVNLDELVPADVDFAFRGDKYVLPGTISVEDSFRMQNLLVDLAEAELAVAKTANQGAKRSRSALACQQKLTLDVEALLLRLFNERRADGDQLEALPFGAVGFQHVLAHVLRKLGLVGVDPEQPENQEPEPAPLAGKPKPKRPAKSASRSRRSRG